MAQSCACSSPSHTFHNYKDELAGGTFTKDSNCCTLVSAASSVLTSAIVPVIAPLVAFGSADSSVVKYLEDDLQWILRTVLVSRPSFLVLALIVAVAPRYEGLFERPLKAWFPNIYWDKNPLRVLQFLLVVQRLLRHCQCHVSELSSVSGYLLEKYRPILLAATIA